MRSHRNPRQRLPKPPSPDNRRPLPPGPTFDYDGTLDVLRDNLGRADAMVTQADELIVQLWSGADSLSLTRRKNHVSYLLEATRLAVRAAMFAGDELDLHRRRA